MQSNKRIVVAGGSLAGQSAVTVLADLARDAEIIWITGELQPAYSKPALSKEFMQGHFEVEDLTLPEIQTGEINLQIIRGKPCVSLDTENQTVTLSDGESVRYDHLIICTGGNARMPAMMSGIKGVYALRTFEDAVAIRSRLAEKPNTLVIGGGLIGCEFAASARALDLDVTLVEQLESLLDRPFGGTLSPYFAELHKEHGVEVLLGTSVERLKQTGEGAVSGIVLSDGTEIDADLVVVGAGSQPATQWLESSGIKLQDGIVCNEFLAASDPHIHAAGDIARWINPVFDTQMRVEHWTNASAQGRAAAKNAVAALNKQPELAAPFGDVPYFWSDQYGQKIQMVGWYPGHDRVEIQEAGNEKGPMVKFYHNDALVAAAAVNSPRAIMLMRRQIEKEMSSQVLVSAR